MTNIAKGLLSIKILTLKHDLPITMAWKLRSDLRVVIKHVDIKVLHVDFQTQV